MKSAPRIGVFLAFSLLGALGCQTNPTPQTRTGHAQVSRNNDGYSLLHALLIKQKDVEKALWFRKAPADFTVVIKQIAAYSSECCVTLEGFAKADRAIQLDLTPLPLAERETRASIQDAEVHALLTNTGAVFRRRLLLSQASSMQYARHLAATVAAHETAPVRKASLLAMSDRFKELETRVVEQLSVDDAHP